MDLQRQESRERESASRQGNPETHIPLRRIPHAERGTVLVDLPCGLRVEALPQTLDGDLLRLNRLLEST